MSQKKDHAENRPISSSARSSPQTHAANTTQQLNTILCEDKNTLTKKPASPDSAQAFNLSYSLSSSQVTLGHHLFCLRSAEKPQKECESIVVD